MADELVFVAENGTYVVARDRELYLMADRALPYGFVVEVMATVQRAGVTNLGMITNPVPDRPEGGRR